MSLDTIVSLALFAGALVLMMRYGGCGDHAMGHAYGRGGFGSGNTGPAGGGSPQREVDPVCGMTVDKATAKSAVHQGQVYYFCSQACREKFEAAPATYATKAGAGAQASIAMAAADRRTTKMATRSKPMCSTRRSA
jgi:YHS domain-containing protein